MAEAELIPDWTPPARGGRWTVEVGWAMVESLRRSGESQGAFARRHGIQEQRVRYWLSRVEGRAAGSGLTGRETKPVTFAAVRVVQAPKVAAIRLDVVVGAAVVRVPVEFDEHHLRRVVAALQGASC